MESVGDASNEHFVNDFWDFLWKRDIFTFVLWLITYYEGKRHCIFIGQGVSENLQLEEFLPSADNSLLYTGVGYEEIPM